MDPEYANFLLVKTREDYNLIAEEFSRTRENIWEEIKFLFNDYLVPGDRVLDLGCGNGRYYPFLKAKGIEYTGVDSSKKLIDITKGKYPGADFRTEDALNLSFPDNHFDAVYSIAVLHHIPSKQLRLQFLKEIKRVLKEQGVAVLTVWKFHQLKELVLLFKYTLLKLVGKSKLDWNDIFEPWGRKAERYYHWFSKSELKSLVEEAGFRVKKLGIVRNNRGNRRNIYIVAENPVSPGRKSFTKLP